MGKTTHKNSASRRAERDRLIMKGFWAGLTNPDNAARVRAAGYACSLSTLKRVIARERRPETLELAERHRAWLATYAREKARGRLMKEGYIMGYCARADEDQRGYNGPYAAPPDPMPLDDAAAPDVLRRWFRLR